MKLKTALRALRDFYWYLTDPLRIDEHYGRRVVLERLLGAGWFDGWAHGSNILEIGPKHFRDSVILLKQLSPRFLQLVDRQEPTWIDVERLRPESQKGQVRFLQADILQVQPEYFSHAPWDLIVCMGVLYQNQRQMELLRRLKRGLRPGGRLLLESATAPLNRNVIEVYWPRGYRNIETIRFIPSQIALRSMLEMTGFTEVEQHHIYSKYLREHRAVFTARRPEERK